MMQPLDSLIFIIEQRTKKLSPLLVTVESSSLMNADPVDARRLKNQRLNEIISECDEIRKAAALVQREARVAIHS
ncbi:MAG: hypothetical protein ACRDHZ_00190 [Ktedonobacteraceae bacterium]